jgi:hypothetical protein
MKGRCLAHLDFTICDLDERIAKRPLSGLGWSSMKGGNPYSRSAVLNDIRALTLI